MRKQLSPGPSPPCCRGALHASFPPASPSGPAAHRLQRRALAGVQCNPALVLLNSQGVGGGVCGAHHCRCGARRGCKGGGVTSSPPAVHTHHPPTPRSPNAHAPASVQATHLSQDIRPQPREPGAPAPSPRRCRAWTHAQRRQAATPPWRAGAGGRVTTGGCGRQAAGGSGQGRRLGTGGVVLFRRARLLRCQQQAGRQAAAAPLSTNPPRPQQPCLTGQRRPSGSAARTTGQSVQGPRARSKRHT